MYDITTIGTLTVDLYFKGQSLTTNGERFELAMGGKYFTDYFHEGLGGGATNVAIGLHHFGVRVSLLTLIGKNSFKPMITEKLQAAGISYIHSKMVDEYLNISCILLSEKGEKTVINYQTPHQHLFSGHDEYERVLRSKYIYLANLPDVSFFEKFKLVKFLKTHEKTVIANFGVVDCRRPKEQIVNMLEHIDVLIVNAHEFADMVKTEYSRISFNKNVIQFYFPKHQDKVFIVTDGKKGSHGYVNRKVYHEKPIEPAEIVDSTGAGDGYSAGFIAEYMKSKDIEASMKSGAKYASKILAKIGAN